MRQRICCVDDTIEDNCDTVDVQHAARLILKLIPLLAICYKCGANVTLALAAGIARFLGVSKETFLEYAEGSYDVADGFSKVISEIVAIQAIKENTHIHDVITLDLQTVLSIYDLHTTSITNTEFIEKVKEIHNKKEKVSSGLKDLHKDKIAKQKASTNNKDDYTDDEETDTDTSEFYNVVPPNSKLPN